MRDESKQWFEQAIERIESLDSKSRKWDLQHYLGVAKICKCKACYCCAVFEWNRQKNQGILGKKA